jgi:beta-galactosidase
MKKILTIRKKLFFLCVLCAFVGNVFAQLVDKTPAAVPVAPSIYNRESYEDPNISGINREASRATAYLCKHYRCFTKQ